METEKIEKLKNRYNGMRSEYQLEGMPTGMNTNTERIPTDQSKSCETFERLEEKK